MRRKIIIQNLTFMCASMCGCNLQIYLDISAYVMFDHVNVLAHVYNSYVNNICVLSHKPQRNQRKTSTPLSVPVASTVICVSTNASKKRNELRIY